MNRYSIGCVYDETLIALTSASGVKHMLKNDVRVNVMNCHLCCMVPGSDRIIRCPSPRGRRSYSNPALLPPRGRSTVVRKYVPPATYGYALPLIGWAGCEGSSIRSRHQIMIVRDKRVGRCGEGLACGDRRLCKVELCSSGLRDTAV
jgi:hypothetical protein